MSRDGKRIVVVQRRGGKRRLFVMSADGTNVQQLAPSLEIQGATGQGVVDWSLDGSWVVAGGIDSQGRGLFKIPTTGAVVRLVLFRGDAVNPVVSPDGKLIVYGGPVVAGQTALKGITANGGPVDLPACARSAWRLSLPARR